MAEGMRRVRVHPTCNISCAACQYLRIGEWPYWVCVNVGVERKDGKQVKWHKDGMEKLEYTCSKFRKRVGDIQRVEEGG